MTTTHTTRTEITANQLRPGDIALTTTGARWFAAFDVSTPAGPGDGDVRVWTAQRDQDNGTAPVIDLNPTATLHVERRIAGPQVTRTTLTLHDDGSVAIS